MAEIAARIMGIAKDNTLAAIILTGIAHDKVGHVLAKIEEFKITREMIICFWTHVCGRDRDAFDTYVMSLTERPEGCAAGCIWEPPKKDESAIFGQAEKVSFHDCAMADCEIPSKYFCSGCYCVRYCSQLCQKNDRARHRAECDNTVKAVRLLKSHGEIYAKRMIKNIISINDASWSRLWAKHGAPHASDETK
jgi:hypothetical protein